MLIPLLRKLTMPFTKEDGNSVAEHHFNFNKLNLNTPSVQAGRYINYCKTVDKFIWWILLTKTTDLSQGKKIRSLEVLVYKYPHVQG